MEDHAKGVKPAELVIKTLFPAMNQELDRMRTNDVYSGTGDGGRNRATLKVLRELIGSRTENAILIGRGLVQMELNYEKKSQKRFEKDMKKYLGLTPKEIKTCIKFCRWDERLNFKLTKIAPEKNKAELLITYMPAEDLKALAEHGQADDLTISKIQNLTRADLRRRLNNTYKLKLKTGAQLDIESKIHDWEKFSKHLYKGIENGDYDPSECERMRRSLFSHTQNLSYAKTPEQRKKEEAENTNKYSDNLD